MDTTEILVLIGLLIANLALLSYLLLKQDDFNKKIVELMQEINGIKENDIREIRLFHEKLRQDFDKKIAELMQEINGIKENDIRENREKIEKLNAEMKQLEQQTRERIDHIAKLLTEPILDESELKIWST
jgi:septal ring factor EnvC (AmiA/AmiB activator)